MNTFLFMYMNSRDVIICYLELRKTRSVFPIPLEFEITKFACTLLQKFFQTDMIFFDQFKVSTIRFGKCFAEFMISIALLKKFGS